MDHREPQSNLNQGLTRIVHSVEFSDVPESLQSVTANYSSALISLEFSKLPACLRRRLAESKRIQDREWGEVAPCIVPSIDGDRAGEVDRR